MLSTITVRAATNSDSETLSPFSQTPCAVSSISNRPMPIPAPEKRTKSICKTISNVDEQQRSPSCNNAPNNDK